MFLFGADTYLEALDRYAPGIRECVTAAVASERCDLDFVRLDHAAFLASPSKSIDYAVMEKTDHGVVIPLDAGWNDIGAWDAMAALGQADDNGNTQRGDVLSIDTHDSILLAEGQLAGHRRRQRTDRRCHARCDPGSRQSRRRRKSRRWSRP
jgi:mannose-1-phosphate guanylyltransferase